MNPLTFPLKEKVDASLTIDEAKCFLDNDNNPLSERKEVFDLFSSYMVSFYSDINFILNYTELFENSSDFIFVNLLKSKKKDFIIQEETVNSLFHHINFKAPYLHVFNADQFSHINILKKDNSFVSLWDWIFEKTNGLFFTSKMDSEESKYIIYRSLYNNFYYNQDEIDKNLFFISILEILYKNSLFDKTDSNLETIGNLYFEKNYAYYSHLNDNYINNPYAMKTNNSIIYSEMFCLNYHDFYSIFQKSCFKLTSDFAKHIFMLNNDIEKHSPFLKNQLERRSILKKFDSIMDTNNRYKKRI